MRNVKIGWSEIDITPEKRASLIGQFAERISDYVEKPITATALAIEADYDQMVMVSVDVNGISYNVVEAVRAELSGNSYGLDPMKTIYAAIHTHTAPTFPRPNSTAKLGMFMSYRALLERELPADKKYVERYIEKKDKDVITPEEYFDFLVKQLAKVTVDAWNNRKEGSYSNEDVGFNHTAKAIMRQYESWDECPHYIWNEMPVYKMIVDENSLTHKNKGEYYQTKHIRGLASNAAHCIKQLDANNIEDEILLFELNTFMVALYYDYLNCSKKYPKCSEENLKQVKDFYNNVYRKYENRPLNSTYQDMALSQKMKPLMKLGVQVNLKRFLRGLKF